ncbi:hypothetical protein GIB67_007961 [Kingdonia uniflora]|uniref:Glycoside hydrolase 35 catalytic domain-containing protein n=1 Tax=Kingdonia uniflora TaxID=39325 RepID=A0A7J7LTS8_9MAGN|nr:hypothetical protein GIB67_007961 [Kingdonia uniflora]
MPDDMLKPKQWVMCKQDLAMGLGAGVPWIMCKLDDVPDPILVSTFLVQYHEGANFGRAVGGPFIATSYDYDASIDEYGKVSTHKPPGPCPSLRQQLKLKISIFSVNVDPDEKFLKNGQYRVLTVLSVGHALHVFLNGQLSVQSLILP